MSTQYDPDSSRSSTLVGSDGASSKSCTLCPNLEVWTKTKHIKPHRESIAPGWLKSGNEGVDQLVIIFAEADAIRKCEQCRSHFSEALQMPESWWTSWCRRSNGYFGASKSLTDNGEIRSYQTWFRFLVKQVRSTKVPLPNGPKSSKGYVWFKLNIFTLWQAQGRRTLVVIFDPRPEIKDSIHRCLMDPDLSSLIYHPYAPHVHLIGELVCLQDEAVWSIRNLVRETETTRSSYRHKDSYFQLHDASRHAIHVSETLEVTNATLCTMGKAQEEFFQEFPPKSSAIGNRRHLDQSQFNFIQNTLSNLLARSRSNEARLANEVQLSFNNLTLFNSNTSVRIGKAAQIDSATLKTIAFLTMTFLPATFVSGMFSMSFFGFSPDEDRWAMSKHFWIYWAIAVPVTLISLLVWNYWERLFPLQTVDREED